MHPAYSVIFFTTASGAGYGLLFWLSLASLLFPGDLGRGVAVAGILLALVLITAGLLASTLHLGRPARAIRAFSQWRTSWLSREGVAAVLTYVPSSLLALVWLFGLQTGWAPLLALLSALGAVVTVYCTGMIYASLRTIRQWHNPLTPFVYLAFAAATGAILLTALQALSGALPVWAGALALLGIALAGGLKAAYWRQIDADEGRYTAAMATGLKGTVRPLDPPHSRPNFVMKEMGYRVARKHALTLRRAGFLLFALAPALAILLALFLPPALAAVICLAAALAAGLGVFVERWLFFAEAEHVSQLYYGAQRA